MNVDSQKRIFTNGCFDVLHRGHIELLKYCKTLGYVIVGLNSDKSVKRLKGDNRPFFSQDDRKFILESCRFVDEVRIFEDDTPLRMIKALRPDMIVKGADYMPQEVAGHEICEVRIFQILDGYSTTNILEKIQ